MGSEEGVSEVVVGEDGGRGGHPLGSGGVHGNCGPRIIELDSLCRPCCPIFALPSFCQDQVTEPPVCGELFIRLGG